VSLCLAAAGVTKVLSVAAFTLVWTHSVEKTGWQEDWVVTPKGLQIVGARIEGSGAGMDPPPDAQLRDGWYRWKPKLAPLPEVVLGNSGVAGEWRFCTSGQCHTLSEIMGHAIGSNTTVLTRCDDAVSGCAADQNCRQ
jgi:hypothetical protein